MTPKCSKCIDFYKAEKRELTLIGDIKAKNESISHVSLKSEACNMIREIGRSALADAPISVETEVSVKGIGKVDVIGHIGDVTMAVECGMTSLKKILALEKQFDIVLHIPYCYTPHYVIKIHKDEIVHGIVCALLGKEMRKLNISSETGKQICLEEGTCSLPSGREGYPKEAMQIAGFKVEK